MHVAEEEAPYDKQCGYIKPHAGHYWEKNKNGDAEYFCQGSGQREA